MKSKDKLNSIYGLNATKPIHKDGEFYVEKNALSKYINYTLRNYAYGIWDMARYDFIYADTDSIKTSNRPQTIIKENK